MTKVWIAVALVVMSSAAARAEDVDDEDPIPKPKKTKKAKAPPPDEEEAPRKEKVTATADVSSGELVKTGGPKARLTLPGGKFLLNAVVEANMAKGSAGKPLSVGPDLWIGVADRLSVGIVHSGRGATGFLTNFGSGLCFRGGGDMGPCALGLGDVYTFGSGELRIGLTEGGFASALVLGAQARAFDPELVLSGKAGFLVRLSSRIVAVELAPTAYIGLTQRKVMGVEFNRDEFGLPVTVFLRFAPRFALALQSGITSTFKKFGDNYKVPAAAGIMWWVSPHFSLDVAFGLAAVADKDDMTKAFDQRSISAGVGYAL